jgi:signal transduction histidine kinase/HAMP domain-containing protein
MPWIDKGLSWKFAIGTAAGLLVSSLAFLVLFVGLYESQLERERSGAASQVSRLLQTSLENAMLKRDLDGLKDIVNRLGREPGVLDVAISNPRGEVHFASHPDDMGKRMPADRDALDRPTTRLMVDAGGRPVLRSINPVHNKPQCQECHGPVDQNPINGILFVDFDAAPIQDQARTTTLLLMSAGALIVLINLTGGWWFMRRFVIRPVGHLSRTSLRLTEGDLDARTNLTGSDELAVLGETFNRMAVSLQEKVADLRDKETFLQQLVDAIPDGIRVIDPNYRVLLSNATYRGQLGLDSGGSLPSRCFEATHARTSPCPQTLITCPLKEVEKTGKPLRAVHRHHRIDGGILDVELYAAPMRVTQRGQEQLLVIESIRDLAQEVKFSHEQKLSELGRLAAGVAHEIHNPLAAVRMALHAAEQANAAVRPDRAQVSEYLGLVDQEVEKCSEVTERLLKLSTPPPEQQELVDVERVVSDTMKLLRWEAETRTVSIRLCTEGAPLRILATDSDLRMVTLNLAQNACHAMPRGGSLTVRCQRENRRIRIDFDDTGIGIDPQDRVRVFEPFFSRRADGIRGTGLGLSITKSIVENHQGTITVNSEPGQGSNIAVSFPDADLEI